MPTGNLKRSEGNAEKGSMNEDEHFDRWKGRYLGGFLDEKTSPAPIKANCNLWYFYVVQFPWQLLY